MYPRWTNISSPLGRLCRWQIVQAKNHSRNVHEGHSTDYDGEVRQRIGHCRENTDNEDGDLLLGVLESSSYSLTGAISGWTIEGKTPPTGERSLRCHNEDDCKKSPPSIFLRGEYAHNIRILTTI